MGIYDFDTLKIPVSEKPRNFNVPLGPVISKNEEDQIHISEQMVADYRKLLSIVYVGC